MRHTGFDNSRSFATEANLLKALAVLNFPAEYRFVICRKIDGRYTAIFQGQSITDGNMTGPAREGFFTI